jgi:hypothetical protein
MLDGQVASARLEAREPPAEQSLETREPLAVAAFQPTGSALTLIVPIQPDRVDALEGLLTGIGQKVRDNAQLPADQLSTVHFFRWVILRKSEVGTSRDYLAFESNYDSTLDTHLEDMCHIGGDALERIYSHCVGYTPAASRAQGNHAALRGFLKKHTVEHSTFYRANPHKPASRIKLEAEAREAVESFVDANRSDLVALDHREIYQRIRAHLKQRGLLAKLEESVPAHPGSEPIWTIALSQWQSLLPIVLLFPVLAAMLRLKEGSDEQWDPSSTPGDRRAVPTLKELEDRIVQNQLSHIVELKPGRFRRFVLRTVLGAIDLLARRRYNQGALGGIATIHFARWIIVDDRFLLFFSNYDGSWENYLGDFIDLAAVGLTGIWSNTRLFPRTRWLVKDGARDEERFKAWTRAHQVPSQVWYSAYPTLSVKNTLANAGIADGLVNPPADEAALESWLELL